MHGRVRPVVVSCESETCRRRDPDPLGSAVTHTHECAGRTHSTRPCRNVGPTTVRNHSLRIEVPATRTVRRIIIRVLCAQHSNARVNNSGTRPSIRKQCMQCCTNPPIPQLQPELARNHAATTLSATALCSHYCAMSTCYIPLNPQLRLVSRDTEASTSSTVT